MYFASRGSCRSMKHYRQSRLSRNLRLRAESLQAIRRFFRQQGYLEVETPIRIPAPAPEAHIDAVASGDWYLQTSPELCMKRLLAAGYERIFQIARCFRHGERGSRHIPELTMLEWYTAGADYLDMMDQTAALVRFTAQALGRGGCIEYRGRKIDLEKPWRRLTVAEAFAAFSGNPLENALADGIFDEVVGLEIEPQLGWQAPVFIYDYPARMGALARLKAADHRWAERFELYIAGLELCNGFSELTDPAEQRRRFEKELAGRRALKKSVYPMPEKFLAALADMPAAAGNALGVDRLVMLLANCEKIDEVVAFTPEEL